MATYEENGVIYTVSMDTADLLKANAKVKSGFEELRKTGESASKGLDKVEKSASSASKTMLNLSKIAATLVSIKTVQEIGAYADSWVTVNNKLANSIKEHEKLEDVTSRVFDIAKETHTSLGATATLYSRLERSTKEYNVSANDLAKLTETINKGFIVSGATASEAEGAIVQLSQGLASGVLRGEEFNSVNEQGNRIARALSDSLGITIGELKAWASQGKLTTDVVVKALLNQSSTIDAEFNKMSTTIEQTLTDVQSNITKFVGSSSTVKSAVSVFNDVAIVASENLDKIALAIGVVAAAYTGKYITSLSKAATSQISKIAGDYKESQSIKALAREELASLAVRGQKLTKEKENLIAHQKNMAAAGIRINIEKELAVIEAKRTVLINAETAAQARLTAATKLSIVALNGLKTGLNLLGGPAGLLLMVAMGFMSMASSADSATPSIRDHTKSIDEMTAALTNLNKVQLQGKAADLKSEADSQQEVIDKLEEKKKVYQSIIDIYNDPSSLGANGEALRTAQAFGELETVSSDLNKINRDLFDETEKLKNIQAEQALTSDKLAAATDNLTQSTVKLAQGFSAAAQKDITKKIADLSGELEIATLKADGHTKAAFILNGVMQALGDSANDYREDLVKLAQGQTDFVKLTQEHASQLAPLVSNLGNIYDQESQVKANIKAARSVKSISEEIKKLKKEYAELSGSYSKTSAESQILSLEQETNTKITGKQREELTKLFNLMDGYKKLSSIENPLKVETNSYNNAKSALNDWLSTNKDKQNEYYTQLEKLESEHQIKIAQIKANATVSNIDSAVAQVDPVQALANENAQKLALIKQFEENKWLTEQRALALRESANYQYEQNRINAQWEIYKNQNEANELLASTIEGLASSTTSTISGLLSGTMSATEAMQNFANVVLNQVVGTLVSMGLQYVKSAVMGQTASSAATSAQLVEAAMLTAAYQPAAMAASIASYGAAATTGAAAYSTAIGQMSAISLAGAREHGGTVDANSMYRVGEGGKPEILMSGGKQYMIPGENGKVLNNREATGSGGGTSINQTVSFNIQTTGGIDAATMKQMQTMMENVSLKMMKDQQRPGGRLR